MLQVDGELSGLPTPDSTPNLRKDVQRHPCKSNRNCNNMAEGSPSCSGSSLGFTAVVGTTVAQQVLPIPHHHGNSLSNGTAHKAGASCTSLHLAEDKNMSGGDGAATGGGGINQQPLPQQPRPLPQAVDVSALDELLQHIQEVSASGSGGIKVLTSTSSSSLFPGASSSSAGHHHHHTRPHRFNHSHHHSNQQPETGSPCFGFPAHNSSSSSSSTAAPPLQQQVVPAARRPSQRHALIKMVGAVPRQSSFTRPQAPFLARMNTNSSCNGAPAGTVVASSCLTRQHSYSEGPHARRAALIRRAVSLKPKVPPKPLFLPNTPTEAGRFAY